MGAVVGSAQARTLVGTARLSGELRDARPHPGRRGHVRHDRPIGAMRGTWRVTAVEPPTSLEFTDAFTGPDGRRIADVPFRVRVRLTERDGGTRMELHLTFESREDMEKLMSTRIVEGLRQAVGQIDAMLA